MPRVPVETWIPADGITLEPTALEVVKSVEHTVVVAGPGAGKTELLAQRAAFLLQTNTCQAPYRVLALCFKREAVRTLRERVARRCGADLAARFDCTTFHAFAKGVLDRHWRVLPAEHQPVKGYRIVGRGGDDKTTLTYDRMFKLGTSIVRRTFSLQRAYRTTYRFVLLDEFQDCTEAQFELIKVLFPSGGCPAVLTAVGDPVQRIMRWAGALPAALRAFQETYSATDKELLRNYRCAQAIRHLIHEMRYQGKLAWSETPEANPGDVRACTFSCADDEANAVVSAIERWRKDGTQLGEIAIFTRQKNNRADSVAASLQERGIAVLNEYERQDELHQPLGRVMLCFWRTLTCPNEQPPKAWTELRDALWSAQEAWGDAQAEHRLTRQLGLYLRAARAQVELCNADAMIEAAAGLLTKLFKIEEVASRWSPSEIADWRHDFEVVASAYRDTSTRTDTPSLAVEHLFGIGAVRLMNIHKCKGMEFERVIVLGVESAYYFGESIDTACELFVGCSRAKKSLRLTRQLDKHQSGASPGINWFDERLDAAGFPFGPHQPPR